MKSYRYNLTKNRYVFTILITFLLLTCLRLIWIGFFTIDSKPDATAGILDVRDVEFDDRKVMNLDGEWEFYPNEFFTKKEEIANPGNKHLVTVPGSWNEIFSHNEDKTAYGFGTYRLRLIVDSSQNTEYGLRISSIRTASEVYINGNLAGKSGQPSKSKNDFIAKNEPYTIKFLTDGNNEIEIIIQVANFVDTRSAGFTRSASFASYEALEQSVKISKTMQQILILILIFHSFYAIVLFFLSNKDRRLLYFTLITLSVALITGIANDDKVLLDIFSINYVLSFKLTYTAMLVLCYSLIRLYSNELPNKIQKTFIIFINLVFSIIFLITLLLSVEYLLPLASLYLSLALLTTCVVAFVIIKLAIQKQYNNIFLSIAIIAVFNNFAWTEILRATGFKAIFYPFDLIVAIVAVAMIWLANYFENYKKLQNYTNKLQETDALKDKFLAQTSHELRNPLHGIINTAHAVLDRERNLIHERSVQDLENVLTVGKRMSFLLNDLLDVMRLKSTNVKINKQKVNLFSIVESIVHLLRFSIHDKSVSLINDIPKNLPLVIADENRLSQILFNLIHNGVKFTNEGFVKVSVKLNNNIAVITVSDTGAGMCKDTISRVFNPYEQAQSEETASDGGFGLGLTISQQLLQLHGSNLEIISTVGKGSKVTFSLPVSLEAEQFQVSNDQELLQNDDLENLIADNNDFDIDIFENYQDENISGTTRPKILIIDDDPFNLLVIENLLPKEDYDVSTVSNGKKALELIYEENWHLVISDVMMPNISGFELTAKIREQYSLLDLPIILLTALSSSDVIERGFKVGANDFIEKPVDATILKARVKALTDVQMLLSERLQLESALLQAQIRPHFLYNTLNSIAALSQIDNDRMLALLNEFSTYLRTSFDFNNNKKLVCISSELNLVRSYLYIEQERFQDDLKTNIIINIKSDFQIPPLTIQPLVENAIKHGILKKETPGTVIVKIIETDSTYEISVEDDGVGMSSEKISELLIENSNYRDGIGIVNTNKRLIKTFGEGLKIESTLNKGTTVSFTIKK